MSSFTFTGKGKGKGAAKFRRKKTDQERAMEKVARKEVKSALKVNIQDKYQLYGWALTPDYNGVVNAICVPAQGVQEQQRVGDQIRQQFVEMKFGCFAGLTDYTIRHIIFLWHPDDSAGAPTAANILTPASVGTNRAPYAPLIHDQRKQFTVMYDSGPRIPMNRSSMVIDKNVSLKNSLVDFQPTLVLGSNKVYHLVITDTALINSPITNGTTRVIYTDA